MTVLTNFVDAAMKTRRRWPVAGFLTSRGAPALARRTAGVDSSGKNRCHAHPSAASPLGKCHHDERAVFRHLVETRERFAGSSDLAARPSWIAFSTRSLILPGQIPDYGIITTTYEAVVVELAIRLVSFAWSLYVGE